MEKGLTARINRLQKEGYRLRRPLGEMPLQATVNRRNVGEIEHFWLGLSTWVG